MRVLVTGSTGFVGSRCHAFLLQEGYDVVGGTRDPTEARRHFPSREFVQLEASDPISVARALEGTSKALYLVHGMKDSADYDRAEGQAAEVFRDAADAVALERVIYLGGVRPVGEVSKHLHSRLETGKRLRSGQTPVVELQASIIVGHGSDSFGMVRDLAARLPMMILPRWSRSRTEPVGIYDVLQAIGYALKMPLTGNIVFPIPGPEVMTAGEIMRRTALLMGNRPLYINVPVLSPRLSSYWLRFVTRTNTLLATELVEGLRSDLIAADAGFWKLMPGYRRQSFNEAAMIALQEGPDENSNSALWWEKLVHQLCGVPERSSRRPGPDAA